MDMDKQVEELDESLTAIIQSARSPKTDNDPFEARDAVLAAVKNCNKSHYDLGKALSEFRITIKHGAWGLVSAAVAKSMFIDPRTIDRYIANYNKVNKTVPKQVIAACAQAAIDPAAEKNVKLMNTVMAMVAEGVDLDLAVRQAAEDSKPAKRGPALVVAEPEKTLAAYTDDFARALALAIRKIPAKHQMTAWGNASASMLWLAGQRGPVTIIPGLRLSGSEPEPGKVVVNG